MDDFHHRLVLEVRMGVGNITHVHQHIGLVDLRQCGAEGGHEGVGEICDEADCVHHQAVLVG